MRAADRLPALFNAAEWFVGRHARGPGPAVLSDSGALTFSEFEESVRRFAASLIGAGVHRGDRVAFILADTPTLAIAFWGAIAAGAVAVPINTLLKPKDHRAILEDCDPRLLVIAPCGVQVPALGHRRARASEDGDRENPAFSPPRAMRLGCLWSRSLRRLRST
jgi:acyl-CoA synthetase (AMP-forming)/AMP-acid ligase II